MAGRMEGGRGKRTFRSEGKGKEEEKKKEWKEDWTATNMKWGTIKDRKRGGRERGRGKRVVCPRRPSFKWHPEGKERPRSCTKEESTNVYQE